MNQKEFNYLVDLYRDLELCKKEFERLCELNKISLGTNTYTILFKTTKQLRKKIIKGLSEEK